MKGTRKYAGLFIDSQSQQKVEDHITIEAPLQIVLNDKPLTVTMCTPEHMEDLVIGLLYAEDIVKTFNDTNILISDLKDQITAKVSVPHKNIREGFLNQRNFLSVSSCGMCGKTDFESIKGNLTNIDKFDKNLIPVGFQKLKEKQSNFSLSGGCHAAGILDSKGNLITVREDIGRHNAVDKVVGNLIKCNQLKETNTLLVSGRISYEIVIKCFRAKIPYLAAVSAPSSLAIDYAKELGISLFAFCRGQKLTQYA